MLLDEKRAQWQELAEEVMSGMQEWRAQHPKATFQEIEEALDERLAKMRARLLQDVAQASAAADLSAMEGAERPRCPQCGAALEARGQEMREVTTTRQQTVRLRRSAVRCPACGTGLFPPG